MMPLIERVRAVGLAGSRLTPGPTSGGAMSSSIGIMWRPLALYCWAVVSVATTSRIVFCTVQQRSTTAR